MRRNERGELLESFEEIEQRSELSLGHFIYVVLLMLLALLLFVPKIYVANQIYYKSRTINKLLDDYEILKEENRLLTQKLEYERYKNQVLDTIF